MLFFKSDPAFLMTGRGGTVSKNNLFYFLFIFWFVTLLIFFTLSGNATTYYISTTGDNGNDGSIGNPWATLAYASAQATTPGDTIQILAGEYTESNYSSVSVGVSIIGADLATTIINYTYVGTEYQACIRLQSTTEGTDGSQIIKNITFDGGLTASAAIAVFARSNVEISDCAFKDFYYKGVYIVGRAMGQAGEPTVYATGNSFHHNTITNCSIFENGTGRGGLNVGGQVGLLIYNNVITQTGRASGSNGYPIKYYNSGYLRGCKIYNNTIRNAVDRSMEFSIEWWNSYGTEIYNNDITGSIDFNWVNKDTFEYGAYVHDNNFTAPNYDHAFGVRFEFSCNDIIVEKNSFDSVGVVFHFSARSDEDYNNISLRYNVANHIGRTGSARAGKFVLFTGATDFDLDGLFILNNTIVGRNDDVDFLQYYAIQLVNNTSTTNTKIINNIITNFSYRPVMIYGNIATNFDFKNNLIYNSGNSNDIYIVGSHPTNYNKSENIAGENPLFVSTTDLQLQSTSPAKNTGVDVGLTTDFEGSSILEIPDIGAYEYQANSVESSVKQNTEYISICVGESYEGWTTTGQYERILTTTSGADSIVTTNLTVNPVYHIFEDITILEGESYKGWTESGQYERILTSVTGCDSIVTTNLTVALYKYTTEDVSICEGESYEGWTTAGQYLRKLTTPSGVDIIVNTNLTVYPNYSIVEDISILEGESYEGWSQAGQYERTLTTVTGCDSVVTTNLTIEQVLVPNESLKTQIIELEEGWNIVSSYLIPKDSTIEDVVKQIQTKNILIEVQDEDGNTYKKSVYGWKDSIGIMQETEGYKIRVDTSCILQINGYSLKLPMNIELHTGWNIISFPYNGSVDAMKVIRPLIDSGILEKVQDEKGNSIENWGASIGWINGIGNFRAGKGYFVHVNENGNLPILEEYEKSELLLDNDFETKHFKIDYASNGSDHMNINIIGLNETNLKERDEIATFDGENCIGVIKLNNNNLNHNIVGIRVPASDEIDNNGYTEGNEIELRFWNDDINEEEICVTKTIKGELLYQKQGSVFVQLVKKRNDLNDFKITDFDLYPNPANNKVVIQFSTLPDRLVKIELIDMSGRRLFSKEVKSIREVIDIQSQNSGIYLVKILSGTKFTTKKLIIK